MYKVTPRELMPNDNNYMLIKYVKEPKFAEGTLVQHPLIGVFEILVVRSGMYYFKILAWTTKEGMNSMGQIYDYPVSLLNGISSYTPYIGSQKELKALIEDNKKEQLRIENGIKL